MSSKNKKYHILISGTFQFVKSRGGNIKEKVNKKFIESALRSKTTINANLRSSVESDHVRWGDPKRHVIAEEKLEDTNA